MSDETFDTLSPIPPESKNRATGTLVRLPPNSTEAEQGVLGCILLNPEDTLGMCVTRIPGPTAFYDLRHRTLYHVLLAMFDEREPIDTVTLMRKLSDTNQIEAVGGRAYVSMLPDSVPSAANLDYYISILLEKLILRKLIEVGTTIVAQAYESIEEPAKLLDMAERDLLQLASGMQTREARAIKELLPGVIAMIEDAHQRQGKIAGIATGFIDFDKITGGLMPGELNVIAARPSMGKTSLAMNIAEHIAVVEKLPVGVFSLEMTAESLAMRLACSNAKVNMRSVRDGYLAERDFDRLGAATGRLASARLYIDDTSGLTVMQLRTRARRMFQLYGIRVFIVDYLQMMRATRRSENRQNEVAEISGGLKELAKELRVPVIALSQLNRDLDKGDGRQPRLSDLRDSGAIEQDADLIAFIYKPPSQQSPNSTAERVRIFVAKQRNGPTTEFDLTFLKPYCRFESAASIDDEDVPRHMMAD